MSNAFEDQDAAIPEIHEQVIEPKLRIEIARIEAQIKSLKALGLFRTAELNQRKLDKLLREAEGSTEG